MFSFLLMSEEEIMQLAGRDFQINFNDVVLPQFIRLFSCFLCIWRQTAQPTLSRKSYSIIIIQIHSPTWAVGHVATRPDPDCQQGFRHGIMGSPVPNNLLSCRPRNDGPYDGPITPSTLHCWSGLSLVGWRGAASDWWGDSLITQQLHVCYIT